MSGGKNLQYIAQPVPKFLQQFKQNSGMKDAPTINDKFTTADQDCADSDSERNDAGPVVVVLKPGDLTKEEADEIMGKKRKLDDSDDGDDGKMKFRQPKKKKERDGADDLETAKGEEKETVKNKKKKRPANGPKNLSLLSFDEDEDT